jgi:hypothetical protein
MCVLVSTAFILVRQLQATTSQGCRITSLRVERFKHFDPFPQFTGQTDMELGILPWHSVKEHFQTRFFYGAGENCHPPRLQYVIYTTSVNTLSGIPGFFVEGASDRTCTANIEDGN